MENVKCKKRKKSLKTIPSSLIAQGLSGLNDAKIQTFPHPASSLTKKKLLFPLAQSKFCLSLQRLNAQASASCIDVREAANRQTEQAVWRHGQLPFTATKVLVPNPLESPLHWYQWLDNAQTKIAVSLSCHCWEKQYQGNI